MTKEQFYRNCLTSEGKEINNNEFTNLKSLKRYYKREDVDLDDVSKWDEIIYIPSYGKVDIETSEINEQQHWQIYTFLDIIKHQKQLKEHEPVFFKKWNKDNEKDLIQQAKDLYNNLNGDLLFNFIQEMPIKQQKELDIETLKQKLSELPKLEQDIIKMRFGISDVGLHPAERDAEEIAKYYNIPVSQVHEITNKVLNKLKRNI